MFAVTWLLWPVDSTRAWIRAAMACEASLKPDQDQGQYLDLDQTPRASATKAAGNFLLSKATKESHQRKMLLF
ncbi:hypothetical protein [Lysobacter sp. Hz 25]|uniref:hypothetical protein n=1 Tax=Lysobacter sp. Hz 25 TaxID=3383698 RepID=UPI0038D50487